MSKGSLTIPLPTDLETSKLFGADDLMVITLNVNGQRATLSIDPRVTLLDALRDHLQLTGTKKGCDHGQCGACTVLVDGARINSCLTFAAMHEGQEITTVEGDRWRERSPPRASRIFGARR